MSDEIVVVSPDNLSCNLGRKVINLSGLLNGENITTDAKNMCLIPFGREEKIVITIRFESYVYLSGELNGFEKYTTVYLIFK